MMSEETKAGGSEISPNDLRQALLHLETSMRMLGKAIHRFSELRAVHNELRYDVDWTGYEVQMTQALNNARNTIAKL